MVKMLLEHRMQSAVCVLDGLCRTPLHWISANRGQSALPILISVLLLERGATPGHRDFAGQLPLHIAASNESSGAGELVRRLIKVVVVVVFITYTMSAQRERCLICFMYLLFGSQEHFDVDVERRSTWVRHVQRMDEAGFRLSLHFVHRALRLGRRLRVL